MGEDRDAAAALAATAAKALPRISEGDEEVLLSLRIFGILGDEDSCSMTEAGTEWLLNRRKAALISGKLLSAFVRDGLLLLLLVFGC